MDQGLGSRPRIVMAGAGSVGCYAGGCLMLAGRDVRLLLRETLAAPLRRQGLRISDRDNFDRLIPAASLQLSTDPAEALDAAELVLVTVKARDTEEMAELLARHLRPEIPMVSLQNGVGNTAILRRVLGDKRRILASMIPFNVVQTREPGQAPHFHRASAGTVQLEAGIPALHELLNVPGLSVGITSEIEAVLWAKLLLNLNNGLNALSGLPLAEELADRRWRMLLAKQIDEGLAVLAARNIKVGKLEGLRPRLIALAMRFPNWLFKLAARRMLAFDQQARSSMWDDLEARRPTEIDYIQGAVVHEAEKTGISVPLNRRVAHLVKAAERAGNGSPHLSPDAISGG